MSSPSIHAEPHPLSEPEDRYLSLTQPNVHGMLDYCENGNPIGPMSARDMRMDRLCREVCIPHDEWALTVASHYLHAAEWANEEQLKTDAQENGGKYDGLLADETLLTAVRVCLRFINEAQDHLTGLRPDQVGHIFWMSSSDSGSKFTDSSSIDECQAQKLDDIADRFPEMSMYIGDDGKTYFT